MTKLASGRAREGDLVGGVLPGEAATLKAAQEALDGHRTGPRALWPFLGPAFIASVAYLDPGNFATDVAAGAKYGYLLLWAVLAANLMAMVVQTLSAKLGIATGRNLAEVCRDNFPRRVSFGLWLQAEVIAMATDLAEVLGAALGLSLLFGIPLGWGAVIAVFCAFAILALQATGFRRLEAVIAVFVGVIVVAFAFELLRVTPERRAEHLGEIGRHRDHLGLEPEPEGDPAREVVAADLRGGCGRSRSRASPRASARPSPSGSRRAPPTAAVAVLRAGGDDGGEVAGIEVRDGGDEGGPEKRPERPRPGPGGRRAPPVRP